MRKKERDRKKERGLYRNSAKEGENRLTERERERECV